MEPIEHTVEDFTFMTSDSATVWILKVWIKETGYMAYVFESEAEIREEFCKIIREAEDYYDKKCNISDSNYVSLGDVFWAKIDCTALI